MIIDCILDRKDNARYGEAYRPKDFYMDILGYHKSNQYWSDRITTAMDYGTEEEVKEILCDYIDRNEYNPLIKDYIRSVTWITKTPINIELSAVIQFEVDTALATMKGE